MARKKKVYVEPKRDLGTMLFTSLMLILLTFFIVLCSMGVQDEKKQRLALNSLLGSFGILSGGASPYKDTGSKDMLPQSVPMSEDAIEAKKVRAVLSKKGHINGMGVSEGSLGVTITLKSNILFEPSNDQLLLQSRELLDALSNMLLEVKNRIVISGHTDSIPIEGEPYYSNWALSSARAMSVLNYLGERGVPYERMAAYGLGAQRPITYNSTEYGRSLNRRVEINIIGGVPGGVDLKPLERSRQEPVKTYQYGGFKFRLEEQ